MTNLTTPWQRLEMIISETGMPSVSKFASVVGLNRGENLYQIKRGNNGISQALARQIHTTFPQYSYSWILTGEGLPHHSREPVLCGTIPFYLSWNINGPNPDSMLQFPSTLVPGATLAVQNPDDGLSSRYDKGCLLFLRESNELIYGKPYLVDTGETLLLRNLKRSSDNLLLASDNPARLDDIEMHREQIKTLYAVCGALII